MRMLPEEGTKTKPDLYTEKRQPIIQHEGHGVSDHHQTRNGNCFDTPLSVLLADQLG